MASLHPPPLPMKGEDPPGGRHGKERADAYPTMPLCTGSRSRVPDPRAEVRPAPDLRVALVPCIKKPPQIRASPTQ
jgi:hypothetical protein